MPPDTNSFSLAGKCPYRVLKSSMARSNVVTVSSTWSARRCLSAFLRMEELVLHRISLVPGAEVLHHPGPVNVSQQGVVPQAKPVEYGGRRDIKNVFQRSVGTHPVHLPQRYHRTGKACQQK